MVAVIGIVFQIVEIKRGFDGTQARLTLYGYIFVALYAAFALYVRLRAQRKP